MTLSWQRTYHSARSPIFARNIVATSQPLAAQAGLSALRQGGSAMDAALAAAISLTVVEPTSNGIGSDAFALVWDGRALHGLNASGRSPAGWSRERFADRDEMPKLGWDSVTVPGAVDGWVTLWRRFGRLPFERLFQDAILYAQDGFLVSPIIARSWAAAQKRHRGMISFADTFLPTGRAPRSGELFRCPDQAKTLAKIASTQGEAFYRGELAARMVDHSQQCGGTLAGSDLSHHRSEWVDPIDVTYHGIRLHELPPNGQGMAALIALGLLEHWALDNYPADSADSIHLQIEAIKVGFAEAHRHVADPQWMQVSVSELLDQDHLARRAQDIKLDRAAFPQSQIPTDKGTVYLTTADAQGMMVSYIQSNYFGFGSGVVVPGTGISLQNRGAGFSLEPDHPNCVGGGKRPYHTIIPGFVTRDAKSLMSFGVMGGHMQPQGHVQMLVRVVDHGQNPQSAADAPRWRVNEDMSISLETGFDSAVAKELTHRGHQVHSNTQPVHFGGAQLILKLNDGYCAASEPRKDGQAVGF